MTRMTVNGEPIHYLLDPQTPLLWALRDASNLTGTKHGCELGECGACAVLLNGTLVNSCLVPLAQAVGTTTTLMPRAIGGFAAILRAISMAASMS